MVQALRQLAPMPLRASLTTTLADPACQYTTVRLHPTQGVIKTLTEKQEATRPKRWPMMEWRFKVGPRF